MMLLNYPQFCDSFEGLKYRDSGLAVSSITFFPLPAEALLNAPSVTPASATTAVILPQPLVALRQKGFARVVCRIVRNYAREATAAIIDQRCAATAGFITLSRWAQ